MPTRSSALAIASVASFLAASGCSDEQPPPPSAPRPLPAPTATVYSPTVAPPAVLGTYGGSTYIIPYAINDLGDIVGTSGPTGASPDVRAVRWATGTAAAPASLTAFPVSGSGAVAYDVNISGQIVGYVNGHAALWKPLGGAYALVDIGQQLTSALGADSSQSNAINASGQVAGVYRFSNDLTFHCFLWTPTVPNGGTVIDLGDFGSDWCYAADINSAGAVAGASLTVADHFESRRAFVWTEARGLVDIAPTAGETGGGSINDAGQVAGYRMNGSVAMAVVWTPANGGGWSESAIGAPRLSGQTEPFIQSWANDINDAGFVVGFTRDGESFERDRAFFWQNGVFTELANPVGAITEPSALTNVVNNTVIVSGADVLDLAANTRQGLRWVVTLAPVTAQGCIASLTTLVGQMQSAGVLRDGESKSLLAKLDAATRQLAQSRPTPARNLLEAFIDEVNALVASGRLTAAQAQPLIDGARCAIAAL